jgi:hypothetical protein
MAPQLSYSITHEIGYPGAHSDMKSARTCRNNTATAIPDGRFVAFDTGTGTTENAAKLPSAATDKLLGVSLLDQARETVETGYAEDEIFSAIDQGKVLVYTEQAVDPRDPVYVRFNATGASGSSPAVGKVRKDNDGVAAVFTITPTAANATIYKLAFSINGRSFVFEVLSDGSGTAQEICDAFRTAMAANADFTALVVATGTVTLILTSQQAGIDPNVESIGPGVLAVVETTPASVKAILASGCSFHSKAAAGALVWVNVNLPA